MMLLNKLLAMFAFTMVATTSTITNLNTVPNASEIVIEEPDATPEILAEEARKKAAKNQEIVSEPSTLNDKTGS